MYLFKAKWQSLIFFFFLQNNGDLLGVVAKEKKLAKHKFPWTKIDVASNHHQPLIWKRGGREAEFQHCAEEEGFDKLVDASEKG